MSEVNFFMLQEDEKQFIDMLFSRNDTLIYPMFQRSASAKSLIFLPSFGERDVYSLILNTIDSAPEQICSDKYTYSLYNNPVIEYSRPYFDGNVLVSGRIYAKIGWLKKSEHNKLYESWYKAIERWLKKRYEKIHGHWWVAPLAKDWSISGGYLALGSPLGMKVVMNG